MADVQSIPTIAWGALVASLGLLVAALGTAFSAWRQHVQARIEAANAKAGDVDTRLVRLETLVPLLVSEVAEIKEDVRQLRSASERFHGFAFQRLGAPASVGPYSVDGEGEKGEGQGQ